MQENVKQVTVKMTARRAFRTEPIWQYDVGHELVFEGFDLPGAFEVHYSLSPMGNSITQIGRDGVCTLPDMYTRTAAPIYAWLYIADEETGLTKYSIEIPVQRRAKPTDQQPTPVQQSSIDQAIAALNDGVEAAEDAQEAAEAAKAGAETAQGQAEDAATRAANSAIDADSSRRFADQSASDASISERNAKASEENAAESERKAKASEEAAKAAVDQYDDMTATATGLAAGASPTAEIDHTGAAPVLRLGIPKGDKGDPGDPGDPTELIDDTAGAGDTTKVWSADKTATEISSLNSALISSNVETEVYTTIWKNRGSNFVDGYLKSNGTIGSANDAYVTDFFEVIAEEPMIIRMDEGYSGSSIHVCFYDSSKTLVNYASCSMDKRRCVGVVVPATSKYCRFDYVKTFPNPTAEQARQCNVVPKEKNSSTTVQGEIKPSIVTIGSLSSISFVTGWLKTDGTITGNEAKTSKYIKLINNNPILKYGTSVATTNIQIAFYDESLTLVEYVANKNVSVPVPIGAMYLSYTIDDSWADENLIIAQNANIAVPSKQQLLSQGVISGLPLNIKYRGLLAGFGNSEVRLRIFGTKNFDYFEQIGESFKPTKGHQACRDPFLMIYKDYYYIFYSDTTSFLVENNDIGVCRTMDFVTYEELNPIVCNENFKVCWAPSIYEENGNYYLTITGSTIGYSETYTYLYDINMDTLTISNERIVNVGTSTRQLDFHFAKYNGTYYAIGKYDNSASTIIGTASILNGPYTVIANQQYSNKPEEGQQIIRLDNGSYRLYINDYSQGQKIYFCDIPDIDNPTTGVGALHEIVSDSSVPLFHVSIIDFNRPYSFQNI